MFVTQIKNVLAVVLVFGLAVAGARGPINETRAADQPKGRGVLVGKKNQKDEKGRPMPKEEPAPEIDKTERNVLKVLTPEEAIKQRPPGNVTVQFKVAKVEAMPNPGTGFGGPVYYIYLHDGGRFTARLARAADQFMKLGMDPVKHFGRKRVQVTGQLEPDSGRPSFHMWVRDLTDIEVVKDADQLHGQPAPPAKTDGERMVGNWFIVNDDSHRKGEMWVISEDSILMYAMHGGLNAFHSAYRLDASKNPKQIDITVSRIKGPTVGVIKGIYVLNGHELRLCLGEMGKDRPGVFSEKPKPGEVLVLQRAASGATPPAVKDAQPEQKVLTAEEAIRQRDKENITVQFKVASAKLTSHFGGSDLLANSEIELTDGKKFSVLLRRPARDQIIRLGIEPAKHFSGEVVRVTGRVTPVLPPDTNDEGPFWIVVDHLEQFEVVRQ